MPISAYSTTPASNTSISGINIGEGCPPSNINDAIRQMMADIAAGATLQQAPVSTGSANAYAVTLTPAPAAYSAGMIVTFIANFTNTAAATVNVNALGAKSIFGMTAAGIAALSGNEIKTNQVVSLIYDGTQFQLISDSAVTTAKIIDSAVTPAKILYVPVATITRQIFTSSGTYTPSAGTIYAIIECWGGGGGGGGIAGITAQAGGGGGGQAGGYSRKIVAITPASPQTVTIGAGGAGGAAGNNPGGSGGSTSVGGLCTASGGGGGNGSAGAGSGGGYQANTGIGDLVVPGQCGFASVGGLLTGGNGTYAGGGGGGGSSSVGTGGIAWGSIATNGIAGNPAAGFASGGGGAVSHGVAASYAGGAGSAGIVFITEYCTQ